MGLSRNREKSRQCARFLGKFQETEIDKATVAMIDFYQSYREYISTNALGYELPLPEFQNEIQRRFPNTKVDNGVIRGLVPKPKRQPIESKADPFDRLMVRRCNELKTRELRPYFRLATLQNYNEIDNEVVSEDQVVDWLNKSKFIFYNKSSECYHFCQDYEYVLRSLR